MPTQNVNLPEHQSEFIRQRVASGRYQNASEVVRAGLRLLEREEEEFTLRVGRLKAELQKGFDALAEGRSIDLETEEEVAAFREDVRRQARARLVDREPIEHLNETPSSTE